MVGVNPVEAQCLESEPEKSLGCFGRISSPPPILKERNPKLVAVCADPYGAAMWSWFKRGNVETKDGDSYAEGIGQTRVTKNLEGISMDDAYRIEDQAALTIVNHLLKEEGLFVGLSSGISIAGAVRLARDRGKGQVIATLLCDSGVRYMSKLFNPNWLKAHKLDPDLPLETVL